MHVNDLIHVNDFQLNANDKHKKSNNAPAGITIMWAARDYDGALYLYHNRPWRQEIERFWLDYPCYADRKDENMYESEIRSSLFPGLKWEDEPVEVKIALVNQEDPFNIMNMSEPLNAEDDCSTSRLDAVSKCENQFIEYACKWLEENTELAETYDSNGCPLVTTETVVCITPDEFVEKFRKAMTQLMRVKDPKNG